MAKQAQWIPVGAVMLTATTCVATPPTEPTSVELSPRTSAAASPTTGTDEASTASAAAHPPTAPGTSASTAPTPPPVGSTTPNAIHCGTVACDLTKEICCFDSKVKVGRCLAKGLAQGTQPCGAGVQERHCDESRDCATGARCCRELDYDAQCQYTERWSCKAGKCGSRSGVSNEVCLAGSTCSNGACTTYGYCPPDAARVSCGTVICNSGEGCCWDPAANQGTCVTDFQACQPDYLTYQRRQLIWCRGPRDCAPGFECFNYTGQILFEDYGCGHSRCHGMSGFLGPFLCDTRADCPKVLQGVEDQHGRSNTFRLTACGPAKGLPGVKSCKYR